MIKYRILAESEEDHNSEVSIKHFYPISRFSQKYRLLHINKFIRTRVRRDTTDKLKWLLPNENIERDINIFYDGKRLKRNGFVARQSRPREPFQGYSRRLKRERNSCARPWLNALISSFSRDSTEERC